MIRQSGRTVVGLDRSADQLRIARDRERRLVHADAAALLAELLNAFLDAGLTIDRVAEPREQPVPLVLAVRARRPG